MVSNIILSNKSFTAISSFGNKLNSKITKLKIALLESKLFRIRFVVYTQEEKI